MSVHRDSSCPGHVGHRYCTVTSECAPVIRAGRRISRRRWTAEAKAMSSGRWAGQPMRFACVSDRYMAGCVANQATLANLLLAAIQPWSANHGMVRCLERKGNGCIREPMLLQSCVGQARGWASCHAPVQSSNPLQNPLQNPCSDSTLAT